MGVRSPERVLDSTSSWQASTRHDRDHGPPFAPHAQVPRGVAVSFVDVCRQVSSCPAPLPVAPMMGSGTGAAIPSLSGGAVSQAPDHPVAGITRHPRPPWSPTASLPVARPGHRRPGDRSPRPAGRRCHALVPRSRTAPWRLMRCGDRSGSPMRGTTARRLAVTPLAGMETAPPLRPMVQNRL